jgi:hypothetical protein
MSGDNTAAAPMPKRLSPSLIAAIDAARILGIRAGAASDHTVTGVWPVVVKGRAYARSWTVRKDGWFQAFLADPRGTVQVGDRTVRVRAVPVRSERVRDAVEDAYAAKYTTKASQKYVRGFRTARRRAATVEFVPR